MEVLTGAPLCTIHVARNLLDYWIRLFFDALQSPPTQKKIIKSKKKKKKEISYLIYFIPRRIFPVTSACLFIQPGRPQP